MKLLFICSSLESGRDGVGDYTRRLAGELTRTGRECLCVAINDTKLDADSCIGIEEEVVERGVRVVRFSSRRAWEERLPLIRAAVQSFNPDWISLQYVPWGYDPKGLPLHFASRLRAIIDQHALHIMCHELWLQGPLFSWRQRLLGALQKICIRRMFSVLQPSVVHTHLSLYREMLGAIGVKSELHPLHGNISVSSSRVEGRAWLRQRIGRPEYEVCLGFFGAIHPALSREALHQLAARYAGQADNVSIVCGGHVSAAGLEAFEALRQTFGNRAKSFILGRLDEGEVSKYLCGLDLGLTSYPPEYVGKSGSVAAMLEHGLRVKSLGRLASSNGALVGSLLEPEDGCSVSVAASRLYGALSSGLAGAGS